MNIPDAVKEFLLAGELDKPFVSFQIMVAELSADDEFKIITPRQTSHLRNGRIIGAVGHSLNDEDCIPAYRARKWELLAEWEEKGLKIPDSLWYDNIEKILKEREKRRRQKMWDKFMIHIGGGRKE